MTAQSATKICRICTEEKDYDLFIGDICELCADTLSGRKCKDYGAEVQP